MKSVCKVCKNTTPTRFTGNFFPWLCETPSGITYCDTRESARSIAREYNEERKKLLNDFLKEQAKQEFYI